ncbi:hypothetical protein Glove_1033g10 [Diversispora epigaea]|uniref:Uncharacterized protein n=1 Tax=Diversispora epigaea TaxID=1348612 RepID=A0A397FXQ6_9GLOM|nr:hypothetical protein Glove_1033g10 [Diversispora epigaea]
MKVVQIFAADLKQQSTLQSKIELPTNTNTTYLHQHIKLIDLIATNSNTYTSGTTTKETTTTKKVEEKSKLPLNLLNLLLLIIASYNGQENQYRSKNGNIYHCSNCGAQETLAG